MMPGEVAHTYHSSTEESKVEESGKMGVHEIQSKKTNKEMHKYLLTEVCWVHC